MRPNYQRPDTPAATSRFLTRIARSCPVLGLIALLSALPGCTLPQSTVEVSVMLPDLPAIWEETWGESGYEISWQVVPGISSTTRAAPGLKSVVLELPKGPVVPIVARPIWEDGGPAFQPGESLYPAGGVWAGVPDAHRLFPAAEGHFVELTFACGPAATILHTAARAGANIQVFNHERLVSEIEARFPLDPWIIDQSRVVRAICEGSMRVDYIREGERESVGLEIPEGVWYGASPHASPLEAGYRELLLERGTTPYYDTRGRRLVAVVDDAGRAFCLISPPD